MSNIVYEALQSRLPARRLTPSGWTSFNAPCCQHRGHRPDRRKRSGFLIDGDEVAYNCFNCQYAAKYRPGQRLTQKMKKLMGWMGLSDEIIRDIEFYASELVYRANNGPPKAILPNGLKTFQEWAEEDCDDQRFLDAATFLQSFDPPKDLNDFYWTPDDNGKHLSHYIVRLDGTLADATGWYGFSLNQSYPHLLNGKQDDEEDDDIPPHTLAEMERLMKLEGNI